MKEDKENARPKEKRGGPLTPAGLGAAIAGADAKAGGEPDRLERPKDKKETLSKVRSPGGGERKRTRAASARTPAGLQLPSPPAR